MDWISRHPNATEGFKREACFTLDYSLARVLHCVDQLDDEGLWHRPTDAMNAVGNILLHLCGNLRQWIVCGCSDLPDDRDRPAEFARRDPLPKPELVEKLTTTVEQAKATIMQQTEADLLRPRFIQIAEVTGLGAIFHSTAHLEGHAQEIIYITRLQLGEAYRFKDTY